jgi:hypothetical protein
MKVILIALMFVGCASFGNVDTTLKWHDGKEIVVNSKADGKVVYTKEGESIEVDNQSKQSLFERLIDVMAIKTINDSTE